MEPFRLEKKEKRFRWRLPVSLFLAGAVIIGVFYIVLSADLFKVKKIAVEGSRSVSESSLISLLESEIIAADQWRALLGSENIIFWLGVDSARMGARLPAVANLKISPNLRTREVLLLVKERVLAGVWCLSAQAGLVDNSCFVFDEEGIVFALAPAVEGRLILKITDENDRFLQPGSPVLPDLSWFSGLSVVLAQLKEAELIWTAVQIRDFDLREWAVVLAKGPVLEFNFWAPPADFSGIIAGLQKEVDLSKLQYIDFRVPNKVYYR